MENDKEHIFLDLDKEVVIFDGERLTEERVVKIAEETLAEFYRQKGINIQEENYPFTNPQDS